MQNYEKSIQEFKEVEREYKRALNSYYTNYCEAYKESLNQQKVFIATRNKFVRVEVESVYFSSQNGWMAMVKKENGNIRQVPTRSLYTFDSGILGKRANHLDYYGPVCLEQVYIN